jgi:hypothetical protein
MKYIIQILIIPIIFSCKSKNEIREDNSLEKVDSTKYVYTNALNSLDSVITIDRLYFSPNEKQVCILFSNTKVATFSTESGKKIFELPDSISNVKYANDGKFLLFSKPLPSTIWDSSRCNYPTDTTFIINSENGELLAKLNGRLVDVTKDGEQIFTACGTEQEILSYSSRDLKILNKYPTSIKLCGTDISLSPGEKYIIIYENDGNINYYSILNRKIIYTVFEAAEPVFSHSDRYYFLLPQTETAEMTNIQTGKYLASPYEGKGYIADFGSGISEDYALCFSYYKGWQLVNLADRENKDNTLCKRIFGLDGNEFSIAKFTQDGKSIIFVFEDGSVSKIDILSKKTIYHDSSINKNQSNRYELNFAGEYFETIIEAISQNNENYLYEHTIRQLSNGQILFNFTNTDNFTSISPSGKYIFREVKNRKYQIVETSTGKPMCEVAF